MREIGGRNSESRMLLLRFGLHHDTRRIWVLINAISLSKLSLVSLPVRLADRKQVDHEAAAVSGSACLCHLVTAHPRRH